MVFSATFNNISAISRRSVLFVEETGVPGKNTDLPEVTDQMILALVKIAYYYFQIFREIAYKAENQFDILSAMHEFTSQTTVLPPGCWDPTTRIEPPDTLPTKVQKHTI